MAPLGGSSSDPSKYEKNNNRSLLGRLFWLQRIGAGTLLFLAFVVLGGDSVKFRNKVLRIEPSTSLAAHARSTIVVTMPDQQLLGAKVSEPEEEPLTIRGTSRTTESTGGHDGARGAGNDQATSPAEVDRGVISADEKELQPSAAPAIVLDVEALDDLVTNVEGDAEWALSDSDTCESYFGNGFSEVIPILPSTADTGSEALLVCFQHTSTLAIVCFGRNMLLRSDRISMSHGGEQLSAVMGRSEDFEVPTFSPGSTEFIYEGYDEIPIDSRTSYMSGQVEGGVSIVESLPEKLLHIMKETDPYKYSHLLEAVKVDASVYQRTCSQRVREPVIFLTRMEYANLFHTSTDWYNVWTAARVAGMKPTTSYKKLLYKLTPDSMVASDDGAPRVPAHVVFLDGHNAGPMDEGWTALFVSASYAKHFTGPVCIDRPILAPFGYSAAISMGIAPKRDQCADSAHVRQFGNDFVRGLGLSPRAASSCSDKTLTTGVLFVRRMNYLAHPRHDGKIVRRIDNEDAIMEALEQQANAGGSKMHLLNGMFHEMTLREQVQAAQEACVLVGAHGAGLSHVLFAPPGVHMLELQPPEFQRPHFTAFATWTGARHHLWATGTTTPDVPEVVNRIVQTARDAVIEQVDAAGKREGHNAP